MATEAQVRAYLEPEEPNYPAAAAALGADALPVLETLVREADPLLASKAAYLASMIPDAQAARVLEEAARSDHPTVRVAAAAGLQRRPDISDEVANALAADPDQGVRKVAAKAARSRAAAGSRERAAGRGTTGRESGGGAPAGAAPKGTTAPRLTEDEHGGGFAPDRNADAEPAAGEGGGDVGDARFRATPPLEGSDAESGGGGDLTGAGGLGSHGAHVGRPADGPDGGGGGLSGTSSTGGRGGASDADISSHGGGRF